MLSLLHVLNFCSCNFNFASSTFGAHIQETYPVLRNAHNILSNSPDQYLLTPCVQTSIKIKLVDKIRISHIELQSAEWLANFITAVKVYVTNDDICLGTFDVKPTRSKIRVDVPESKYTSVVKVVFVSFIGKHDVFALTQLKVHGKTFVQSLMEHKREMCKSIRDNKLGRVLKRKYSAKEMEVDEKEDKGYMKYVIGGVVMVLTVFIIRKRCRRRTVTCKNDNPI